MYNLRFAMIFLYLNVCIREMLKIMQVISMSEFNKCKDNTKSHLFEQNQKCRVEAHTGRVYAVQRQETTANVSAAWRVTPYYRI